MSSHEHSSSVTQPPGTVLLEDVIAGRHTILLQPQPSSDPNDPLNWPRPRKLLNFFLAAFYTLFTTALLNLSPVLWQDYNEQLGISFEDLNNCFAANCAGLAIGCLLFIPFALKYGRRPVYIVSLGVTFATAIWQALLRDLPNMMASQVISGLSGAVCDVLVQMTVADVFFLHERGTMNGWFLLFFNGGATFGPIVAGVIANRHGWPWVYWCISILLGALTIVFIFCYEETKFSAPSSVSESQVEKGTTAHYELQTLNSHRILDPSIRPKTYWQRLPVVTVTDGNFASFLRHAYQPLAIMCLFPAVAYTALQYGAMLAWFSLVVTTESTFFSQAPYNFNTISVGLLNLAPLLGVAIATIYSGLLSDWSIQKLAKRNSGVYEPEMRLYPAALPALIMPAGLFLYGYSVAKGAHWIVPCVGVAMVGFGLGSISILSLSYLLDCYREIVGDALVGVTFFRNAFSAGIVFAISPWIETLGLHDATTSVGCLALLISLTFIPMIIWGKQWRAWCASRYAHYTARQFDAREQIS